MNYYLSLEEIKRKYEDKQKYAYKCKCGHTVFIVNKSNMCLCSHCKNLVFKDKKTEFEYRMREKLLKEKRKKNGKKD